MPNFRSAKEHASDLAFGTMNNILSGNQKTSQILRGCLTVASLVGDHENKIWIEYELSGYSSAKQIPFYRKFKQKDRSVEEFSVQDSIHRLEHAKEFQKELRVWSDSNDKVYKLPPEWCHSILYKVEDRCLHFLLNTITHLQYSQKIDSIIENIQKEVDRHLISINSEINSELQSIYIHLSGDSPSEWSKAAHSCRRALKLLADEVFPPTNTPFIDSKNRSRSVKEDDFMNRLLAFLETKKAKKIINPEIDVLASYFDDVRDIAGKGEHSSKLSRFEVEQVVIHTYLIISEIVKLIKEN